MKIEMKVDLGTPKTAQEKAADLVRRGAIKAVQAQSQDLTPDPDSKACEPCNGIGIEPFTSNVCRECKGKGAVLWR